MLRSQSMLAKFVLVIEKEYALIYMYKFHVPQELLALEVRLCLRSLT
jgi:hypothetical protein